MRVLNLECFPFPLHTPPPALLFAQLLALIDQAQNRSSSVATPPNAASSLAPSGEATPANISLQKLRRKLKVVLSLIVSCGAGAIILFTGILVIPARYVCNSPILQFSAHDHGTCIFHAPPAATSLDHRQTPPHALSSAGSAACPPRRLARRGS